MKKLIILAVFVTIIGGVYYGFKYFKDQKEKEIKDSQNKTNEEVQKTVDNITGSNPVDTIRKEYNPVCSSYIDSINYQIAIDLMNGTNVPEVITDPNYTISRETPLSVYLEIGNDKTVKKGTVTYEKGICVYENGKTEIKDRTN